MLQERSLLRSCLSLSDLISAEDAFLVAIGCDANRLSACLRFQKILESLYFSPPEEKNEVSSGSKLVSKERPGNVAPP